MSNWALGAQALDGPRQRELRAAETLDEVAAARDPERLQTAQLGVERREAARDAFGEHELAREDPVALEQQLRQRAPARGRVLLRGAGEERRGQRPAPWRMGRCAARAASR